MNIKNQQTIDAIKIYIQKRKDQKRLKTESSRRVRAIKKALLMSVILFSCVRGFAANVLPATRQLDWATYTGHPTDIMINATQTISQTMTVYTNLATNVTTTAFNNAINNCPSNQVVQLTNGTYTITAPLDIDNNGVVIRGMGRYVSETQGTRLAVSSGYSDDVVIFVDNNYELAANINYNTGEFALTNLLFGSQNVTSMVAHGRSVGDRFLIDQYTNLTAVPILDSSCGYCGRETGRRPIGHFVEVTAVPSSTTLVVTPPISYVFSNSLSPRGQPLSGWVTKFAMESLTIDTLAASGANPDYGFLLQGLDKYWFYDVELTGIYYKGNWSYGTFRGTWQKCYFNGNRPIGNDYDAAYTSQRAYGLYMGPHNSFIRIVDNQFNKLTVGIAFEGCILGSAFAYNFSTNSWWRETDTGSPGIESKVNFSPLMHGPCPAMNLVEGNHIEGRWRADSFNGSSVAFTIHRNRIRPRDRRVGTGRTVIFQGYDVEMENFNHNTSFIGNVLGLAVGFENVYEHNGDTFNDYGTNPDITVWKMGYDYNTTSSTGHDTNVMYSAIRWDNWDTFNQTIMNHATFFCADTNTTTLTNSYLYPSKPAWFGNRTWPPVDARSPNNDSVTNVPAAARFVGINIFDDSGGSAAGGPTPKFNKFKIRK